METVKLYYENAFLQDFTAVVESCGAVTGGFAVVLDRTVFYPEGGGQPADHGTLGDARVLDAHEKDGVVTHLCDRALPVGAEVSGHIDWARRFDHMQQHSGEHIVSGMLCSAFHCDNVGFHLGADTVTIDYNADISWEQVQDIERLANRYIWENHPIHIWYPSPEELAALPYRSKKALEGPVRLTEFPGADLCACCGTHVAASGQVGLVKFIGWQKFRDGVRLELLCGQRALDHLSACWEQSRQIGQALSVKPEASFAAVERMQSELLAARERAAGLEAQVFAHTAAEYAGKGDTVLITAPLEGDGVRRLCDAVAQTCGGRCAVFSGTDGTYRYALIHAGQDIRPLVKDMNETLHGRGGGRDGFAQGSAACTAEEIRAFFSRRQTASLREIILRYFNKKHPRNVQKKRISGISFYGYT